MVRLKGYQRDPKFSELLNFNSTMVRLKVELVSLDGVMDIFQFHYGSIKSR